MLFRRPQSRPPRVWSACRGKGRQVNIRFSAMVSHFLFAAEFCNPASGWEKGQIEKNVQDARHRLWQDIEHHRKRVRFFSTVDLVNALELEKAQSKAGQIAARLVHSDLIMLESLACVSPSSSACSKLPVVEFNPQQPEVLGWQRPMRSTAKAPHKLVGPQI